MKTADLIGASLDWAVADALDHKYNETRVVKVCRMEATTPAWIERESYPGSAPYYHRFEPSRSWAQGAEIIERDGISIIRADDDYEKDEKGFTTNRRIPVWCAARGWQSLTTSTEYQSHDPMYQIFETEVSYGPTPLIAAMRCFVASVRGEEVSIPAGLLT